MVYQTEIALRGYPRGFHLITRDILESIGELPKNGVLHIFYQAHLRGVDDKRKRRPDSAAGF